MKIFNFSRNKQERDCGRNLDAASMAVCLWHSDLSRNAWLITIVGSVMNAALATGRRDLLKQAHDFLPGPFLPRLTHFSMPEPQVLTVITAIDQFYGQIDFAQRLTISRLALIDEAISEGGDETPILVLLADTWRKLALAARLQLFQVQSAISLDEATLPAYFSDDVIDQLKQVERGNMPCVDTDGTILLGRMLDQRGTPRIIVNMNVQLKSRNVVQQCVVTDVSCSGIGLSNVFDIEPGEHVSVQVCEGVELPGHLIWIEQGNGGIQLKQELSATEWFEAPLLEPEPAVA